MYEKIVYTGVSSFASPKICASSEPDPSLRPGSVRPANQILRSAQDDSQDPSTVSIPLFDVN